MIQLQLPKTSEEVGMYPANLLVANTLFLWVGEGGGGGRA